VGTAVNNAVDCHYVTGRLPTGVTFDNRTHVLVREANYNPDGGQLFFPRDKDPFIALLALPGDDNHHTQFHPLRRYQGITFSIH
jgi:hypothetical protein